MNITYHNEGDFQIPDLTIEEKEKINLTKYGRMRLKYLIEHKRVLWNSLTMKGELQNHLLEIDQLANKQVMELVQKLAEQNQVNEKMKSDNQMLWVQMMNNFKNQAEEMVMKDLIYS